MNDKLKKKYIKKSVSKIVEMLYCFFFKCFNFVFIDVISDVESVVIDMFDEFMVVFVFFCFDLNVFLIVDFFLVIVSVIEYK